MRRSRSADNAVRCSFCHKRQADIDHLISSPSDYPRAYICDECIRVCSSILADGRPREKADGTEPLAIGPPEPSEYPAQAAAYISLVPGNDVMEALTKQGPRMVNAIKNLNEEDAASPYAPGKWSIKEVLGHVIDTERIWAYRALHFARQDPAPLAAFDGGSYVRAAGFNAHTLQYLVYEFTAVRDSTVYLLDELDAEAWMRRGTAGGHEYSVRALAYMIAGHELHHRRVLEDKYGRPSVRARTPLSH